MASTYAPPSHRYTARVQVWQRSSYPLLLLVAAGVFIVTALALLIPQTGLFSRALSAPSAVAPQTQLGPADVERVLAYARSMQPDDTLIQVRPGVFAKRSNVEGIDVGGTRVYYDVASHQSFGPLRAGTVRESDVTVVGREATNGFLIVVYTKR
ncbi:MAG TPA: hypothetical protein VFX49_09495 [Chloroflexota bacterium]|nr:hypothetical protein [Chloroflexota bacterium]